jgi:DNA-binding beta-propeller fold protein YncE
MFNASRTAASALLAAFAAALALAACEDSVTPPVTSPVHGDFAFITTTDYSTGSASIVSADTLLHATLNVASVHSDALARFYDGRIYVLNRQGADNVQVLDPQSGFQTIKEFSVGNGADPEDIVFSSPTRAFVSRYNEDQLWIVDPNLGRRTGVIDFAWLADADFIPEMAHMVKVGRRVFVAVQRLDRNGGLSWPPVGTSYLAVFDADTGRFIDTDPSTFGVQPLALAASNPFGELVYNAASGKIWVPNVGRFGEKDGGVEVVDPATLTTSGVMMSEATLGGDITDVVALDANRGVAIVGDTNFNTLLVGFDLSAPASIDTLYAPGDFVLQDAELSRDGRIFVSDRTIVLPGIRVFRADTGVQITTSPIDVGLPPADIEFGVAH